MRNAGIVAMLLLCLSMVVCPALPTAIDDAEQDYFARALCRFQEEPQSCCHSSCQIGRMARESAGETAANPASRIITEEFVVVMLHDGLPALTQLQTITPWKSEMNVPHRDRNVGDMWHPPTAQPQNLIAQYFSEFHSLSTHSTI